MPSGAVVRSDIDAAGGACSVVDVFRFSPKGKTTRPLFMGTIRSFSQMSRIADCIVAGSEDATRLGNLSIKNDKLPIKSLIN